LSPTQFPTVDALIPRYFSSNCIVKSKLSLSNSYSRRTDHFFAFASRFLARAPPAFFVSSFLTSLKTTETGRNQVEFVVSHR
jgi:hypothetical protein